MPSKPRQRPIWLHHILRACGIRQDDFAEMMGVSRTAISRWLTGRGGLRKKRTLVLYRFLAGSTAEAKRIRRWLEARGVSPDFVYQPYERGKFGMKRKVPVKNTITLNNVRSFIDELAEKKIMIKLQTLRHFGLRRSPFDGEIGESADVFLSEDHIFIREMMLEAARYSGFVAIHGEVGCGKSTMRKGVVKALRDEDIQIIFPQILDKRRITASSLLDAIVMDITDDKLKQSMEAKTRQAINLLKTRRQNGLRQVLILEEAQLLNIWAIKHLKQIYEFEDGYQKLIGIILIGQPELAARFDETQYPQLREVTRRVTSAEITGLAQEDIGRYLKHKVQRVKGNPERIFTEDAYPAFARRLRSDNGTGDIINRAYPLTINNLAATALNMAAEMGEPQVTGDLVMGL